MRGVGVFRLLIALHEPAFWMREWMVGKCSPLPDIAREGSLEGNGTTRVAGCGDGSPAAFSHRVSSILSPAALSFCKRDARPHGPQGSRWSHRSMKPGSGRSVRRESGTAQVLSFPNR